MTKLDTLAYRLKDLETLRNLFSELNFDFEDGPVSKDGWTDYQKSIVRESKIIASKSDYRIYYIQTYTDSIKQWKDISAKIIKANNGFAMVCAHNPRGIKWVFSSLAKEFSKSFSETRHIPIDIRDDAGIPKTFVEFLAKIRVGDDATASSIMSQMSEAFDSFAIQIHDELTVNVFEALKSISEGIILDKSNGLALDEQTLDEIREPTFILLYRIMFVLYAEDRSVFPDSEYYYDNFSLKWIKQEWILNDTAKIGKYGVQKRLRNLFRLIEVGSEGLDYKKEEFFMRSYYGRLFDRKIHSQLEKWNIPNENILKAIDLLTRTRDRKGNYFFLDYAALETRHLGAIYEHLLEFHLTVKDGKVADLPNPKERKSTGSYYTPKYIVDYIVENTVGPLIDNIVKETSDPGEQIDKILALNVLDPAMGSGHFLVGVTNYIARRICIIEYGEKDTTEHAFVERKRDVARRCIYGVDINPLAVDLAQVSLWLETLSSERPLSFLSAHLKSGNSLIGSSISDILDKQTTIVEATTGRDQFKKNIRDFIMLEMLDDDTPEAVRAKTVKYSGMQSKGTFYHDLKFLLDAKIAKDFGVDVPPIGDFVAEIGQNSLDFYAKGSSCPEVQKVAEEHSFFHWDLEFPDIFYGEDGKRKKNLGFDAVVGNPPWLSTSAAAYIGNICPEILKSFHNKTFKTKNTREYYAFFFEKALNIMSIDGQIGYIVSLSSISLKTKKPLQKLLIDSCTELKISSYNDRPGKIFEGGTHARSAIILGHYNTGKQCRIFTTISHRWKHNDLRHILNNLTYIQSENFHIGNNKKCKLYDEGIIPKIGFKIEKSIMAKFLSKELICTTNNSKFVLWYHDTARYWIRVTDWKFKNSHVHPIYLKNKTQKTILMALLNSSLAYWFFNKITNNKEISSHIKYICVTFDMFDSESVSQLNSLTKKLYEHYAKKFKAKEIKIDKMFCKNIIDKIDDILSQHYKFNEDERIYIKQFEENFRLGDQSNKI